MRLRAEHVQTRYRAHLAEHPGGGQHLDAMAADPRLLALVGDGEGAQYGGDWSSPELLARDACGTPSEAAPRDDTRYWVDDRLAAAEQWAAYRHLALTARHRGPVLQVGGRGTGLVRWMRATGRPGVLLSPFSAELDHGRVLARSAGVVDGLLTVRAPAEAVPLSAGAVGTAMAPGVLHHTDLAASLAEVGRVVAPDGRWASWDVWSSPAYRAGIALFGKQEEIRCRPLDAARFASVPADLSAVASWGGCLTRYPVALAARLGRPFSPWGTVSWGAVDRALCRGLPALRALTASTVMMTGSGRGVVVLPDPSATTTRAGGQRPPADHAPGRPRAR